jgi:hypothetical protein
MAYDPSNPDYIPNQPRPDAPGNVSWTQTLLIQNYAEAKPIVIDKEIKGGLHRVKYRSQLYDNNYDGIFTARRVRGMLCFVEWEDDGITPVNKYYSLTVFPGTSADHWTPVGSGSPITINNPQVVQDIPERDALEREVKTGTINITTGSVDITGNGTLFGTEVLVGDQIKFNGLVYTIVTITSPLAMTVNVAAISTATLPYYKILVEANDFVNVVDSDGEGTPASYIWNGTEWLTIYPYADDPNSHVQNTDTGLMIFGSFITGDAIWNAIHNDYYRKQYNDLESLENAAAGPEVNGNGNNAYSSKKIATELLKRPVADPVANPAAGNPLLFLNQTGKWTTPPGGGPGGPGLETGDILGGGGADKSYFGEV